MPDALVGDETTVEGDRGSQVHKEPLGRETGGGQHQLGIGLLGNDRGLNTWQGYQDGSPATYVMVYVYPKARSAIQIVALPYEYMQKSLRWIGMKPLQEQLDAIAQLPAAILRKAFNGEL